MSAISYLIVSIISAVGMTEEIPATLRPEYVQMVDSADYYLAREMWVDAKRCTVEALKIDPANFNNSMLFSNLGIIDRQLGDLHGAINNFTLGLNIAPANSTLRTNRARVYLEKGDYNAAKADLQKLTEADGGNDWAWKMLGTIWLTEQNVVEGMKCFRMIDKPDPDTLRMMASISLGNKDYEGARGYYDQLLSDSPSEESWFDHAWFLLTINELDGAKEDIKDGLKQYPRSGSLVLLRAYIHKIYHERALSEMDVKLAKEYGVDGQLIDALFPSKHKKKNK